MEPFTITDELPLWSAPFGLTLLDTVRPRKGMTVLDIGSGSGFPMLELAERLGPSCTVFGVEPSEQCVAMISGKITALGITNARIVLGTAEELPFGDDNFDLIISNNGLNNVDDEPRALLACYRAAKPGAQLVTTFNLPHTMTEFYDLLEEVLNLHGMNDAVSRMHDHIFEKRKPVEYYIDLLKKTGFDIRTVNMDGFKYRFNDGSSFLQHHLVRSAFLPHWKEIVAPEARETVFRETEERLNQVAADKGFLEISVPYVCIDFFKP
jgi:arsenite methyltransferase